MTVWIVNSGSYYDGGGSVESVHLSEEGAYLAKLKIEESSSFSDQSDYVNMEEFEVQD